MSRSYMSLFVANLRLLDLDRLTDWPDISTQTFSTAEQQNQKARIKCTEWALYRLFEIWDPTETRNKLQPFFPPFEPLQSINLRAALFRSLNELKKNGVLGRESILRKTMLDECKGDKFIEILFLFSTTVLRKGLEGQGQKQLEKSIARRIATAGILTPSEQRIIVPLIITHASALSTSITRKASDSTLYGEVHELLKITAQDIAEREEKCNEIITETASNAGTGPTPDALKKQLQENWVANENWLSIAIHGDEKQSDDDLLSGTFKEFLRAIQTGDQPQNQLTNASLLDDLEFRAQTQQQRLRRWKTFQQDFTSTNKTSVKNGARRDRRPRPSLQLKFADHESIKPGASGDAKYAKSYHDITDYQNVVEATLEELKAITRVRNRSSRPSLVTQSRATTNEERAPKDRKKATRETSAGTRRYSEKTHPILPPPKTAQRGPDHSPAKELIADTSESSNAANTSVQPEIHRPQRPVLDITQPFKHVNAKLEPIDDVPPTLADQIIASVNDATPSPVKRAPRLSLSERAKQSMAAPSLPSHTANLGPVAEAPSPTSPDHPLPDIPEPSNRRTTLLERTRQSMNMLAQQPKPRPSMARKRESRQSLFPVDQFETPKKTSWMLREYAEEPEEPEEKAPPEAVYSEDVDYDSIFKSRPKIAVSPVASPSYADLDDATPTKPWESSPLGKFNSRKGYNDDE